MSECSAAEACLIWDQEAAGSNPAIQTIRAVRARHAGFMGASPSSSVVGPGHPFLIGGKKSGENVSVDWLQIKMEYVTTQISTRELARKHGLSHSQIARRSSKEGWAALRETARNETETLCIQKTVQAVSDCQADRMVQLMQGGEQSARLLIQRLDQIAQSGKIKPYEIKAITEALKNVRDLYKVDPGSVDEKFQKARELLGGVPDALDG